MSIPAACGAGEVTANRNTTMRSTLLLAGLVLCHSLFAQSPPATDTVAGEIQRLLNTPGLEIAGTICAVGSDVNSNRIGEQVCALVSGGGYAQYCVAEASHTLPVPKGFSMDQAAALPETYFTVWHNVFQRGHIRDGETLFLHGGTSGIVELRWSFL